LEGGSHCVRKGESPPGLPGLGLTQHPLPGAIRVGKALERGDDAELAVLEVDCRPLECESFPKPGAEAEDHGHQPLKAVTFECSDDRLGISWCHR
jgi:hypothetical protein